MDKKNTLIGVLLLVAAFGCLFLIQRFSPPAPRATPPAAQSASQPATVPAAATAATPASTSTFATVAKDNDAVTITRLSNGYIEVRLTDFGGAINDVAFAKYPAELGNPAPFVFNRLHADPILAFSEESPVELGRSARYQRVSASDSEVVYRLVLDGALEVTRRYSLASSLREDPKSPSVYVIHHETTFRNLGGTARPAQPVFFALGTASLIDQNDYGQYLNVATYNGSSADFSATGDLEGAGFIKRMFGGDPNPKPFLKKEGPVVWGSVKNQFFASIFTADKPGSAVIVRRIGLPPFPRSQQANIGLTGSERFEMPALAPGATATINGSLYIGPKEYPRLASLSHNEDEVMQFSRYLFSRVFLSGYVAPFMNTLMNWTHHWGLSWGLAIVVMTLIIKTVSLPFTLAASRSAKRMQKFQPEIQAIREKYKDNPQKLNEATLKLFKEHKINPMGGCLPMLITMPLFIGFFSMLQSSAELRFQSFLWAPDLSAPDTVWRIPGLGFPLNIMPLLMGATMIFQMRLTPQPTVDNAQAKMMKFMPVLFTLFCYSFSCALALYSTVNGLFTIGQQLVINRMKDDEPATPAGASSGGMKNVTPGKKKGRN